MEILAQLGSTWGWTLKWLVGLAIVGALLSRVMPCNPGMYWWKNRRSATTDLLYWLIMPLFLSGLRGMMLMAAAILVFGADDREFLQTFFVEGYGPFKAMPILLQCVLILLIEDVMLYWIHRGFHRKLMWKFHAVHHSTKNLDWISTQRFHPVNNLLAFAIADITVLLMGFSPLALVALTPFNMIYSAMVHANLNWTFGPFKYVFASPVFHRWHHTHPREGGNKNFAPTFPVLDVMFGTFYMPEGKLPESYGVTDPDFPEGFIGQFLYPFLK